jgi:peptidoglycan/LPS O-acetylase OafA/YrhL
LTAQEPPSPLLNFWSLAVEEQFYLVYPAFFAVLALVGRRVSLRVKLAVGLTAVIVISFVISAAQTNTSPTAAYFSPVARAWELALGALIAVSTSWLLRLPKVAAGIMTWVGLGAIGFSAVVFGANTAYPGTAVAVPVLGAGLVIAGGASAPAGQRNQSLG